MLKVKGRPTTRAAKWCLYPMRRISAEVLSSSSSSKLSQAWGDPDAWGVWVFWGLNAAVCWNNRLRPQLSVVSFFSLLLVLAARVPTVCLCSWWALWFLSYIAQPPWKGYKRKASSIHRQDLGILFYRCICCLHIAFQSQLWICAWPLGAHDQWKWLQTFKKRCFFEVVRAKRVVSTHS